MGNNHSWLCGGVVGWFCLSESIMMFNRTRSSSNLNSKAIQKIHSLFQKSLFNMTVLYRDRSLMGTCCHTGVGLEGGACSGQYWPAAGNTPVEGVPGQGSGRWVSWGVAGRARERETKGCLLSLTQAGRAALINDTEDSLSSLCLGEHSDWRGRGQWVSAWCSWCVSSVTAPPSEASSYDRYEALQVKLSKDSDSSSMEVLLRLACSLLP